MDQFPPTYDFPMDPEDGTVYTDIHMDPNSIPIPAMAPVRAINDNISDEEEEEEEFEEDPEEDQEEDHEMDPIPDDDVAEADPTDEDLSGRAVFDDEPSEPVTSGNQSDSESDDPTSPLVSPPVSPVHTTTPDAEPALAPRSTFSIEYLPRVGGPRVIRTARKSVRFAGTDYASTSRARAPHHSPTPSITPSPTPGRVALPTPTSPIGYTPSSEPSSPAPLSPYSLPYSPDTQYGIPHSPAAKPHPPSPARETPSSAPNQTSPVSPRSPHPALFETTDPVISSLRDNAYAVGNRISQIEQNLTEIPGPDSFDDLEERVQTMGRRMDHMAGQVRAMERRIADQVGELRMREGADRVEIRNLRRRLQILEDRLSGSYAR